MSTIEEWRGRLGRDWAARADVQDRMLAPLGEMALERLEPLEGARVLDLGCGAGATTLALAERGAQPVGVDVSPDLLSLAESRAKAARARVRFVLTDAGKAPPPGPFDALFSRFGCMFFDAPAEAWSTIRGQMAGGAPMSLVAWRHVKLNDWAGLPLRLIADLFEPAPPMGPGAPGPFGWADRELVQGWLEEAGWRDIAWEEADVMLEMGMGEDPDPLERGLRHVMEVGPVAARLREAPEKRPQVEARLREGLAEHVRDGALRLGGAVWLVGGRA
ncbi:MAG: class I SAM-dependent methyltransferase [Pseudomonadota bacterium]